MNLNESKTLEVEENLTNAAKEFESYYGRFPEKFEDLITAGYIKEKPLDHENKFFIIDHKNKSIKSPSLSYNQ